MSYSHEDCSWRDAVRQMLGPALDRYGVEFWADDHTRSGDRWERVIGGALEAADLGLLLVSPAYLQSTFSWEIEVPQLVARGLPIVWLLLEDCLWEDKAALWQHQGLQDPGRDGALADQANPKKELARLCRKIRDEHFARPGIMVENSGIIVARGMFRTAVEAKGAPAVIAKPNFASVGIVPVPHPDADRELSPGWPGQIYGLVPNRPQAFVTRAEDLNGLRTQLVAGLTRAVGVIGRPSAFGLYGRGGIGKTVLASELVRDDDAMRYFPDGLFWLTLGERPAVVTLQRQLARWLGGEPADIGSPSQGTMVLRELAEVKQCLVVLDDVWSLETAKAFAVTGPKGRLLLTTRNRLLLEQLGATPVGLDVLSHAAAIDLLGKLTATAPSALPPEADSILEATGRVALVVALVGAAIGKGHQGWGTVAARLAEGLEVFAGHPYAATFTALEAATAGLGEKELVRYQMLACFPEDTIVPSATIGRLWGLPEREIDSQLGRFAELGLVQFDAGGVAFHDLQRAYLLLNAQATSLAHDRLLAANRPLQGDGWHRLDPDEPYMWDHLAYHLAAAGCHQELLATVADPAWLAARIARDGTLAAEGDLTQGLYWEPSEFRLKALLRLLRQSAHLLDLAADLDVVPTALAIHL